MEADTIEKERDHNQMWPLQAKWKARTEMAPTENLSCIEMHTDALLTALIP